MPDASQEFEGKKLETVVAEKTGALSPDDSITTAGERMRAADSNAWPVTEGRKLVGVIDQSDPDRKSVGHGHDPTNTHVRDEMRRDPFYCYEDQDAAEAQRMMAEHDLKHLPVVDREMRIVGIISRSEVDDANAGSAANSDATKE